MGAGPPSESGKSERHPYSQRRPRGERVLIHLTGPGFTCTLDEATGGRVTSLSVQGTELLVQEGEDMFHWGSFPMAPWVGRLRDGTLRYNGREHQFPLNCPPHALHGLVTERHWQVTGPRELSVDLAEPWPWRGRVVQRIATETDSLVFHLRVESAEPMPVAIGWHPWFRKEIQRGCEAGRLEAELRVSPRQMCLNDASGLPTGELGPPTPPPWDDCFTGMADDPVIRWGDFLELRVQSTCRYWVIYDREDDGLCVEPWSDPPNSLNMSAARVVAPGQPLEETMRWTWRVLGERQ